ncbi:hypothetical protein F8M41_026354 [Gigaspora margarita]|uniref:Uncharacterized protein n=1 Tax=Gigaspora margarita TaxID=4874 RepID=A0A8H4ET33_GIGMA|nr:hypothetical protein F8M41_026354 [Gigaspora margarita]
MNTISVSSATVSQTERPEGDAVNQCSIMYTVSGPGAPVTEDPYGGSAVNQCSIIKFYAMNNKYCVPDLV